MRDKIHVYFRVNFPSNQARIDKQIAEQCDHCEAVRSMRGGRQQFDYAVQIRTKEPKPFPNLFSLDSQMVTKKAILILSDKEKTSCRIIRLKK
jgi:hypothetical protein